MDGLHPLVSSSRALNRTYEEKLVGMAARCLMITFISTSKGKRQGAAAPCPVYGSGFLHLSKGIRSFLLRPLGVEVLAACIPLSAAVVR